MPQNEEYGRHTSFRPTHDSKPSRLPVAKAVFALSVLIFVVVLGHERLWGRGNKVQVSQAIQPTSQEEGEPSPDTLMVVPVSPSAEASLPVPLLAAEAMPPTSVRHPPAEDSPPPVEAEKPDSTVTYVMEMKPGSSSFVGQGSVNGKDVVLLADTGASTVVVPEQMARRLGLKKGTEMSFRTAGGVVPHYSTTIDRLTLGRIELRDVEAAINPAMREDFILLGMSALKLVEIELDKGKKLVLKHRLSPISDGGLRTVGEETFTRTSKDCASNRGNKFDQQTLDCLRGK